jgi:hypothetical protein
MLGRVQYRIAQQMGGERVFYNAFKNLDDSWYMKMKMDVNQ